MCGMHGLAKELHQNFSLVAAAPISVVSWFISENKTDANLHIRVYTVLKSNTSTISELSFQGEDGWDGDTARVNALHTSRSQPPEYSAVAASRDTIAKVEDPVCVFYQPRSNVIDLTSMPAENDYKAAAESLERPQGIPTSRASPFQHS
jgi:hypothetical protein